VPDSRKMERLGLGDMMLVVCEVSTFFSPVETPINGTRYSEIARGFDGLREGVWMVCGKGDRNFGNLLELME
jgi:hypothetical protein